MHDKPFLRKRALLIKEAKSKYGEKGIKNIIKVQCLMTMKSDRIDKKLKQLVKKYYINDQQGALKMSFELFEMDQRHIIDPKDYNFCIEKWLSCK